MQTLQAAELKGQIDLAIITATEETHRAALKHFVTQTFIQGRRSYTFFTVPRSNGLAYNGVLLNLPDVGNQAALSATRDLIDDLDPPWIVSLGVGKALPSHRFSLGDVIIADRIANLALETRQQRGLSEFDLRATEMAREVSNFQGTLLAKEVLFQDWHQGLPTRGLALEDFDPADFYGDKEWQEKVRNSLKERFAHLRPRYHVGMVASSDKVVENQRLTTQIKSFIRSVCLLETELAGICRAAENRPVLGICGIGSIVGLKAGFSWQEYAARSAAALTFALLSKTDPIEKTVPNKVGQSIPGATSTKPVSGAKVALQVLSNQQHKVIYDQKLALLPEVEAPMSSPLYWPAQNA